ncbi:unnamed protein product [Amaranthus hypochondriacus]
MASSHTHPGLVFHHEQPVSRPYKDFSQLLPSSGSRQELTRSNIFSLMPYEQDNLFKSMNGVYRLSQFAGAAPIKRMPLPSDVPDKQTDHIVFSYGIDELWSKRKQLLEFMMSGSNEFEKEYLESLFPDLVDINATAADMHLLHLASDDFESKNISGPNTHLLHPSGSYYDLEANSDLVHDLPCPTISDLKLPIVDSMIDVKDMVSVLEEFKVKDSAWRKQVLVPNFGWSATIDLQDEFLKVDSPIAAPLKSPEKVKRKQSSRRKNKRGAGDRDPYKTNSVQACELLLSLMMDKNRNQKSLTNSIKKAGPALPLLLTQFSASITGTGLAVMFTVLYKMACGSITLSITLCTSNLLTSGLGVGLFWLSGSVNKLRDTVVYIGKNSTKAELGNEVMMKVDKSVNDIFFRTATLMVVFVLRLA